MTKKGGKQEPPLHLDLDFGEALRRLAQTDPKEVEDSIKRSKQKRPGRPERRPASLFQERRTTRAASAAALSVTGCGSAPERVRGDRSGAGCRS
jgi:hypothetical protein